MNGFMLHKLCSDQTSIVNTVLCYAIYVIDKISIQYSWYIEYVMLDETQMKSSSGNFPLSLKLWKKSLEQMANNTYDYSCCWLKWK